MSTDPALEPRIGILGGTFDPIHIGHLVAAQAVLEALGLERILWIPSGDPPHKAGGRVTSAQIRWQMVQAALEGDGRFEPLDLELRRPGPSYTVDTLRILTQTRPPASYFLLLGSDQWREFGRWREPSAIEALARLAIMTRGGDGSEQEGPRTPFPGGHETGRADSLLEPRIHRVHVPRVDVSSSWIRQRIQEGGSARYLVPEPALRILEAERLYL